MRIVFTLLLLVAAPLAAHPLKLSETTVTANSRTGNLEVAHSLSLHDMVEMLRNAGASRTDVIADREARAAAARYVAGRFHISADRNPVALALIGSEVEGGHLWVYQEAAMPAASELFIDNRILLGIFETQQNRVNIDMGGPVRTLVFRNGSAPQSVLLD